MNKKILGILVMTLLIATTIATSSTSLVIDQQQVHDDNYGFRIWSESDILAQEFRPSLRTHSEIRLKMFRYGDPVDYNLKLTVIKMNDWPHDDYKELYGGGIIASKTIDGHVVNNGWVIFSFDENFNLTIGEKYFMVLEGDGGSTGNYYCWNFISSTHDYYSNGDAWDYTPIRHWTIRYIDRDEHLDFCFRTFCWNSPPEIPTISGPKFIKPGEEYTYTISTTDVDNHSINYYVDWGDGETQDWALDFQSGEEMQLSHAWEQKDNYIIRVKARDVEYHEESDWATLEVSMPKHKAIITPFIRFLENHPHMFPLLRQILKLQ